MSNDYDEYAEMEAKYNKNMQTPGNEVPAEVDIYDICNSRVKMEHASRLGNSLVLHFNDVLTITQQGHTSGALLIEVMTGNGLTKELWLPKKLCSNLDLEAKTLCIWDKFWKEKAKELDHMGGLAVAAEYYKQEVGS
jgi:hypothetical protein